MTYKNLMEAQKGVLMDAVSIAASSKESFAVVGGWSPFLLNSSPIRHPGTRDVDLLFAGGTTPGRLRDVYKLFLEMEYLPSAKHPFQLIRIVDVSSKKLAFNVDFLHPRETVDSAFVDHIELPIPVSPFYQEQLRMKSVLIPASKFIFEFNRIEKIEIDGISISGKASLVEIPVIDEAGLIVTKSYSFQKAKRDRDIFDIYIAIAQCRNRQDITSFFRKLKRNDADTFNTLYEIQNAVLRKPELLKKINEHLPAPLSNVELQKVLIDFLHESGVEPANPLAKETSVRIE